MKSIRTLPERKTIALVAHDHKKRRSGEMGAKTCRQTDKT